MKPLIYVVEDELSIRELYTCTVEGAGMEVNCYESGKDMFENLKYKIPDLFLLDIMLNDQDGYEILKILKSDNKYKDIPIIMVSAKGEEISKVKGLNLGADDYIAKPFGVLELVARIKANLRKYETRKEQTKFSYKDLEIDDEKHKIIINGNIIKATLKEYNLLKLLVQNSENIVKRDDIWNEIWGIDYYGETRTLDIHIKEIRKKLSQNESEAEIKTVRSVGYILQ